MQPVSGAELEGRQEGLTQQYSEVDLSIYFLVYRAGQMRLYGSQELFKNGVTSVRGSSGGDITNNRCIPKVERYHIAYKSISRALPSP